MEEVSELVAKNFLVTVFPLDPMTYAASMRPEPCGWEKEEEKRRRRQVEGRGRGGRSVGGGGDSMTDSAIRIA